jgi:magnesium and cobalt transporter
MSDSVIKSSSLLSKLKDLFDNEPEDRDDLLAQIKDAFNRQIIDVEAWRMLQGVMSLSAQRVRDIMVPRAQMVMLNERDTLADNLAMILETEHSRYPVTGETKDDLVGILMSKDLLIAYIRDQVDSLDSLSSLLRPVFYVPESKRAAELLREFQSRRLHIAVAVDEYGSITGLVTIEDIIEGIVGEIEDEYDKADVHIMQMNEHTFTVKAVASIDEVNAFFDVKLDIEAADTLGGLIVSRFGRVPQTGESLALSGLLFKVLRADRRRVQLFKVTLINEDDIGHGE